jgi:lysyl-tRNA synthetase class 2
MEKITGRVIAVPDPLCFILLTENGIYKVRKKSGVPDISLVPWDIVVCSGVLDGGDIIISELSREFSHYPHVSFPDVSPDYLRFHGNNGKLFSSIKIRSRILRAIRSFFDKEGFLEVETPAIVNSPGLEVHIRGIKVLTSDSQDAGKSAYLITSPEYHMKRLLAAGFEKIYQITKVFRSDEKGYLHNPEFTMLEWYRAFADYEAIMEDLEKMIPKIADLIQNQRKIRFMGRIIDLSPPWERITFEDAFKKYAGIYSMHYLSAQEKINMLVEKVERNLGNEKPVFLIEFPSDLASLARRKPDNPEIAERFELYISGVEIANAFSELTDAEEQHKRFDADLEERKNLGLEQYPVDRNFLAALRCGMPTSAGVALGIDRLVMIFADSKDIDEVIAFPWKNSKTL